MQHDVARKALLPALDEPDLRISATAIDAFQGSLDEKVELLPDLFERLQRLIERAPAKPQKYPPPLWPWTVVKFSKAEVAAVLAEANGAESTSRLIPYLSSMEGYVRARVIGKIGEQKRWDDQTRKTLFELVGDASGTVREAALKALTKCKITGDEAKAMEALLSRKAGDLRRGVLSLLAGQGDDAALASADR